MSRLRTVVRISTAILISLLLVALSALVTSLGGFLNHCRGGYVHFGPDDAKQGTQVYNDWYWPQHVLGRLLFALPTGLLVLVCGLHLKASVVVAILTWFSLYAGWGTYMNIGTVDNYCSRAGIFDWLLGRQGYNCTTNERFIREYSGMSLRGLIWTMPQGYALEQMGFGWEYSLTGTIMPLIYYIGANTHVRAPHLSEQLHSRAFLDSPLAMSELLWGMWVWFVLIQACLTQGIRRARIWIYKSNPHLRFRPFSTAEKVKYESLNRPLLRAFYETVVVIVTILFCFTAIYYSLIVQKDVRNKGQTFFGIFTAILFLFFLLSWIWGVRHRNFVLKRYARRLRGRTTTNNAIYNGSSSNSNSSSSRHSMSEEEGGSTETPEIARAASVRTLTSGMDHYEALFGSSHPNPPFAPSHGAKERRPLLSWPYSHPDRLSPTEEQRQQVLDLSEAGHRHPRTNHSNFVVVWTKLEKYIWMDIFIVLRRTIGLITLIGTIFSMMMTVTATIIGWNNPRFMYQLDPPCT